MGLRILLFLLTNFAVMVVFFLVMMVFDIEEYTEEFLGQDSLLTILFTAAFFGFSGSIISLLMSKSVAKKTMGVTIIEKGIYYNDDEKWLYETVEKLAAQAGINTPEVGIYKGKANAFATGPSRNNSLVAVSTGLYKKMDYKEIEAVLAHEIGHVANGDMVTQTLLQGVLNTFVIFMARILGRLIDKKLFPKSDGEGIVYIVISFILEIIFSILATLIIMWFSRYREYRADEMGAKLAGKENMINALKRLGMGNTEELPSNMVSMGIIGGKFVKLFSTHPSLEKRIENLKNHN